MQENFRKERIKRRNEKTVIQPLFVAIKLQLLLLERNGSGFLLSIKKLIAEERPVQETEWVFCFYAGMRLFFEKYARVLEWSKSAVCKTVGRKPREFESLPLLQIK